MHTYDMRNSNQILHDNHLISLADGINFTGLTMLPILARNFCDKTHVDTQSVCSS